MAAPTLTVPFGKPHANGRKGEKRETEGPKAFAAAGLEAVHLLASSLRVDRSLSTAVRFAARHGSDPVRVAFERVEWEVQVRHHRSIDDGFFDLAALVGRQDPALKRALLTLHGAESEPTREGLERRLDRALDIVSKAEDQRRDQMSTTLERPVTLLLGTGVVLPLVLVSLLPLLRVAQPAVGPVTTGLLLLVAVPVLTVLGASSILDRNTLGAAVSARDARRIPIVAAIPVAVAAATAVLVTLASGVVTIEPPFAAGFAAASAAMASGAWLWRESSGGAAVREEVESQLPDLLHSVGSKMTAGRPAEQALLESVEGASGDALRERLRGVLFDVVVGRRDLGDAIARDEELQACGRAAPSLRLMASAAGRDTAEAGRVVQHLAEFERLRLDAAASLRTKVRSVVETARTTAVLFAPLILGVTAGMYGLLSTVPVALVTGSRGVAESGAASAFALTVTLYIVIQAVVVEWFAARMLGADPAASFGKAVARDLPLAVALFLAAYTLSRQLF